MKSKRLLLTLLVFFSALGAIVRAAEFKFDVWTTTETPNPNAYIIVASTGTILKPSAFAENFQGTGTFTSDGNISFNGTTFSILISAYGESVIFGPPNSTPTTPPPVVSIEFTGLGLDAPVLGNGSVTIQYGADNASVKATASSPPGSAKLLLLGLEQTPPIGEVSYTYANPNKPEDRDKFTYPSYQIPDSSYVIGYEFNGDVYRSPREDATAKWYKNPKVVITGEYTIYEANSWSHVTDQQPNTTVFGTAATAGTLTQTLTLTPGVYQFRAIGNLTVNSDPVTVTVTKRTQTVTLETSAATSDLGGSITFTASGSETGVYAWTLPDGATASEETSTSPTRSITFSKAGSKVVSVLAAGTDNYEASAPATATVTVLTPLTFDASPLIFYYDGTPKAPSISTNPTGGTFSPSGDTSKTDVGSYSLTVTANGDFSGSGTFPWAIAKGTQAVSLEQSATTSTVGGSVTFTASGSRTGSYDWTLPDGATASPETSTSPTRSITFSSSGSKVVSVLAAGTDNYEASVPATATVTVNKIATTFSASQTSFVYNGATQGPSITPSPAGASFVSSGDTSAVNVGNYTLTTTASGNYGGSSVIAWSINKANQAVTLVSSAATTAVGGSVTLTASGSETGVYAWTLPAGATSSPGGSTAFQTVVFSTSGTKTISIQASGDSNWNTSPSVSATVTVLIPQTVAISSSTYTPTLGTPFTLTASGGNNGYVWGGTVTGAAGSGTTKTLSISNVGTYTVSAYSPAGGAYADSNTALASITVDPKPVTFSVSGGPFYYTGVSQGPNITVSDSAAQSAFSITGSNRETAVGSYSFTATASGNYTGTSGLITWSIARGSQSAVSITSATEFDFSNAFVAQASGGNGSGAIVWSLGTGSTAPGAAINSASGAVTTTGPGVVYINAYRAGDSNYQQSLATPDFAITVKAKPVTFSITPTSFIYTGSAQRPTVTASDPAATYSVFGTASATNAGSYSITVTAHTNYSGTSGIVPWSITKGTPTVSISPVSPVVTVGNSQVFTASGGRSGYAWAGSAGATGSGTTKTVSFPTLGTFNVIVSDPGDNNWFASDPAAATVTVDTIATTFSAPQTSFVYNGATQGPSITPSPAGASFVSSGDTSAVNVGSYTLTTTASGNYGGSSVIAWSINPATPAVTISPGSQTVAQGSTITFTASGGQNTYNWSGSAGASGATGTGASKTVTFSTVGTQSVSVQSTAGGNYTASNTASTTITVAPIALFGISGATDYGTVRVNSGSPLTSAVTYTLSNTGSAAYTVTAASASGDFTITAINGGPATFPFTVNPGSSATLTVIFNATAIGSRTCSLTITNNSVNTPAYTTTLSGFGSEGLLVPTWSVIRVQ